MTNTQVASLFNELADIMEIAGENNFKIRAYRNAAKTISSTSQDVISLSREMLRQIPGIGKAIAEKIESAKSDGTFPTLQKWRHSEFAGFLPLLEISGLTPRKLGALIKDLSLSSIHELGSALSDGRLDSHKKMDEETRGRISEFIAERFG